MSDSAGGARALSLPFMATCKKKISDHWSKKLTTGKKTGGEGGGETNQILRVER